MEFNLFIGLIAAQSQMGNNLISLVSSNTEREEGNDCHIFLTRDTLSSSPPAEQRWGCMEEGNRL